MNNIPLLQHKSYDAPSIFTPSNLPCEAWRQKGIPSVLAQIDPKTRQLHIIHRHQLLKKIPLKGLPEYLMSFEDYLEWIG